LVVCLTSKWEPSFKTPLPPKKKKKKKRVKNTGVTIFLFRLPEMKNIPK
jgi:hypothetical protein